MNDLRLTVRIDFGSAGAIGPGKIRLLEAIRKTGSISQAGRSLGMSYRRAWLLIDDLNRCFRAPVVVTRPGGAKGGGAELTQFGRKLIEKYRAIEAQAASSAKRQMRGLKADLRGKTRARSRRLRTSIQASSLGD
ncbi:MAG: winged helix-turn-helix domain-containing protein [Xanthobacteraceae bacterium]